MDLGNEIEWAIFINAWKFSRCEVIKLVYSAATCPICGERNLKIFQYKMNDEMLLLKRIVDDIRAFLCSQKLADTGKYMSL